MFFVCMKILQSWKLLLSFQCIKDVYQGIEVKCVHAKFVINNYVLYYIYVLGLDALPAAELELVVLCKHQQAAISLQKQHAPMAARIILSALKLLKKSQLFKPCKEAPITKR